VFSSEVADSWLITHLHVGVRQKFPAKVRLFPHLCKSFYTFSVYIVKIVSLFVKTDLLTQLRKNALLQHIFFAFFIALILSQLPDLLLLQPNKNDGKIRAATYHRPPFLPNIYGGRSFRSMPSVGLPSP